MPGETAVGPSWLLPEIDEPPGLWALRVPPPTRVLVGNPSLQL
ncbi:MAG: hypothetical protein ACYCTI_01455 [Acidimicrobiales bacterium]